MTSLKVHWTKIISNQHVSLSPNWHKMAGTQTLCSNPDKVHKTSLCPYLQLAQNGRDTNALLQSRQGSQNLVVSLSSIGVKWLCPCPPLGVMVVLCPCPPLGVNRPATIEKTTDTLPPTTQQVQQQVQEEVTADTGRS